MKPQLSICIPIYNQAVAPLVQPLLAQGRRLAIPFEIYLLDDGSQASIQQENAPLAEEPEVTLEALPHNLGRSAARNALIDRAQGDYLLFLDNDGRIIQENFLVRYWENKVKGGVVCGGRRYPTEFNAEQALHAAYGRLREARSAQERALRPYHGFQSHNFLAHRSVLDALRFDEAIAQYGHEDTLFGFDLAQKHLAIKHIEAPVEHHDLMPAAQFLEKQARALEGSLDILARRPEAGPFFRLNKWAQRLATAWWAAPLRSFLVGRLAQRKKALLAGSVSLHKLDLWRLGYLLKRMAQRSA